VDFKSVDDAAAGDGLRVTRMAVPLRDTEAENLLDHLEPCLDFVDEGRKGSGTSSFIASPGYPGGKILKPFSFSLSFCW